MKPAYSRVTPVSINGTSTSRLMLVLQTSGCEFARKTGGCTVCGFLVNAKQGIAETEIIGQLDHVLETTDLDGIQEIDLLTLGSFFNDNEVTPYVRRELLSRVAALDQIKRVSLESRAEYVTAEKLAESKSLLGTGKLLEFGIGLESADDHIRNVIIKKALPKKRFEGVAAMANQAGCDFLTYLLIKPPSLSEGEAIRDAVDSAKYVFDVAARYDLRVRIAYEPVFIPKGTPLDRLFVDSGYRLLNLWSIVEVIQQSHRLGNVFIGLSDENLSDGRFPTSCLNCCDRIVAEIEEFNGRQDVSGLARLDCECRAQYEQYLNQGLL